MERSFARETESLRLGDGEVFRGNGVLALTGALFRIEDTPAGVPNRFTRPTRERTSVH